MEDADYQQLKQRLLELQTAIMETEITVREGSATVELDQSRVGRLSRMDAMQLQQMSLQNERRRQQLLHRIHGALRRIEAGDYGDCFICGEPIAMRRLMTDPTLTRCIECVDEE